MKLKEALTEAIVEERVAAEHGIAIDLEAFLKTLFEHGYIVVRNTEPSEHGFNCHVCGCEFGGYEP